MPLHFTDLTPRQMRAIKNMTDKGLVLQISTLPTITFIQKDTGEVCTFTIEELCEEYDYDRFKEAFEPVAAKGVCIHLDEGDVPLQCEGLVEVI